MTKQKSVTLGLITFVVTLIITVGLAGLYINRTSSSRKERASFIADSIGNRIEAEIDNREYIARVFEIQLKSDKGQLSQDSFYDISDALFNDYLDVIDISLAPGGVVEYIYPATSSLHRGTNFFEDERYGIYADYSKMSKVSVIISPATLNDDTKGIIVTKPIYLDDDSFWGFATITVDETAFMTDASVFRLADEGYEYELIGNNVRVEFYSHADVIISKKNIEEYCRDKNITEAAFMQAAVAETLKRLVRRDKLVYVTASGGRGADTRLLDSVGMYVRTVPVAVETKADANELTEDFISGIYSQMKQSLACELYPYTEMVSSHDIKAEIMFTFQGGILESGRNKRVSQIPLSLGTSKFPIVRVEF